MTGFPRARAALVLVVTFAVAGCHLTGGSPADLGPGRGRVDRTFPVSLANSVRGMIDTLDDLQVRPKNITIRANEAASNLGKPAWNAQTNSEYFPDDASFHDLFDAQRLTVKGAEPVPFAPILMSYQGETEDGLAVNIVVRSQPPDAAQTMIMARVGHDGDEALARQIIDKVATRLARFTPAPPALPALPDER